MRALLAATEQHPDAACSIVTLVPETFRQVPTTIRVHDASLSLLRRERPTSGTQAVGSTANPSENRSVCRGRSS